VKLGFLAVLFIFLWSIDLIVCRTSVRYKGLSLGSWWSEALVLSSDLWEPPASPNAVFHVLQRDFAQVRGSGPSSSKSRAGPGMEMRQEWKQ